MNSSATGKIRVVRVVTASYVVPWHLNNTLKRIHQDFEVCVVGQNVSKNRSAYPEVKFVDIDIHRKTSVVADAMALFALVRFFRSYKPDIVHSVMPKAGLLAVIAGFVCRVPIRIHTFTGQTWVATKGLSRHIFYLVDWFINAVNTICLTDSYSQSDFLFKNHISHAGKPLPVLSKGSLSGVDVERFNLHCLKDAADLLRDQLKLGPDDFIFSYIARKTRAKGAIDTLRAFSIVSARFRRARLLFVGPDEDGEIEHLRTSNPELFDSVCNVGYVDNHEVYLAITDVLCLPSYREGFGSIIIDAAAMGVPAIGSKIPGLTDSIVDGQTGVLISAGDTDELAKQMMQFIETPQMRQIMGDKAKARVDEFFSADRLYTSLREFYMRCIAGEKI